jgi:hypothetical protein
LLINSHSPQPDILPDMERPEFWIDRFTGSGKVILDAPAISAFNCRVMQSLSGTVYDLASYPASLRKPDLQALIAANRVPKGPVYGDGRLLTPDDGSHLESLLNLEAVPEDNVVAYGFTLRRTNLRSFPTTLYCTMEPADMEFDLFQETALNPAEPLLILFWSADRDWYYIQSANFRGWVAAKDIVRADSRESWLSYFQDRDFLVVSANHYKVSRPNQTGNMAELHFEMGAKLPLDDPETFPDSGDFRIIIPARDVAGRLCFQTVRLPRTAGISRGYLPYTGANIITQAFKMLGMRYGWGGTHQSVDCSSFVMNIYRSFGFYFPRNSREQERLPGKTVNFEENQTEFERADCLNRLLPGAILNLPGHVMLYLGEYNGSHFIIHALSSYGVPDSRGGYVKTYFLKVCVTGLDLTRSNGQTLWAALTSGRNIF